MTGISLPAFPSRTNLKLHNISVTPKILRKVVINLDLSKASAPDCLPVMALKNYATTFLTLYLRMLGKGLLLKTTALLVFLCG